MRICRFPCARTHPVQRIPICSILPEASFHVVYRIAESSCRLPRCSKRLLRRCNALQLSYPRRLTCSVTRQPIQLPSRLLQLAVLIPQQAPQLANSLSRGLRELGFLRRVLSSQTFQCTRTTPADPAAIALSLTVRATVSRRICRLCAHPRECILVVVLFVASMAATDISPPPQAMTISRAPSTATTTIVLLLAIEA